MLWVELNPTQAFQSGAFSCAEVRAKGCVQIVNPLQQICDFGPYKINLIN